MFQADLTAKDNVIVRKNSELTQKNRELRDKETQLAQKDGAISWKDRLLAQKDTLIADKEATIAEREALIQVSRPEVTLYPTLVHLLCWLRCSLTCIQAHREQIELKDAELARRAAHMQQLEVGSVTSFCNIVCQ